MSSSIRSSSLTFVLGALLTLGLASSLLADDHHACSNRSVAGKWSYSFTGTALGEGPVAGVGVITLDKNGTSEGKQTYNYVGTVLDQTLSGTYSVNPDCTGNTVLDFFIDGTPDATIVLDMVWSNDSNDFRMVTRDTVFLISIEGKRLSARD